MMENCVYRSLSAKEMVVPDLLVVYLLSSLEYLAIIFSSFDFMRIVVGAISPSENASPSFAKPSLEDNSSGNDANKSYE